MALNQKWKSENGFKSGFMNKLEEMISAKLLNCALKAEPHIESRLKQWFEKYCAMAKMLSTSGFGWDDEKKILQVERSVFDEWAKNHKKAKGLYGVPFPYYDILAKVYGKDRATGEPIESFVHATQNINVEMTHESVTLDSDDDLEVQTETESMRFGSGASGSRKRKDFLSQKKQSLKKKKDEVWDLSSSLHSDSTEFGKVFKDMNLHLGVMAQIWGSEEERKKKLNDFLFFTTGLDWFVQCSLSGVIGFISRKSINVEQ